MSQEIIFYCKYDELINPKKLKNHPKNRNKHGQDQIDKLAELFKYHGIRHPIIVSNLSGCIVAGHGRKLAAIRAGLTEYPVVYQEFASNEAEYAFLQADNAIALWAELDLSGINADLPDLGPDFDINMLGIKDFVLDTSEFENENSQYNEKLSDQNNDNLNRAWSEWCKEILKSIEILQNRKIFSQSYNKSLLKIYFLNALYKGDKIPRSATLGYQYHRMLCSGDGNNGNIIDLLTLISEKSEFSERIRFSLNEKPSLEKLVTVAGVPMKGFKAPLDFPVELALELYNEYGKNGKVLDPCHGWGGRYLGFALSNCIFYQGCDPSDLTSQGLLNIHQDLKEYHNKEANFLCLPYEKCELEDDYFDFAMTSPPYFDREEYIGGDQAHLIYKTYEDFIDGFYTELFKKTYKALKSNSYFIIQVGNQKYDLDKQALKIASETGFSHVKTLDTKMSAVGASSDDEISEILLYFKKD